jgi:tRNA-uridine 2-sulfurtransferase
MRSIWSTGKNSSAAKGLKAFVGLSGGVDSAVAAALLQQAGYDVTGVFIRIALEGYPCTAAEDKLDAMRVAAHLKIPFRSIDLSEAYGKRVFSAMLAEFERGRTPNPDALCNREIKFGLFFEWCMEQGADYVATGHYARTEGGLLYAAADVNKDQSYFLALVPQEVLQKTIFPLGVMQKPEVRALATKLGLPNAERPDSQGLCFLGPVSVQDMLQRELSLIPGDVLNDEGEVIGTHEGVQAYTLGQRHGFTLSRKTPASVPLYTIAKDQEFNTITVSPNKFPPGAQQTQVALRDVNWIGDVLQGVCKARYRYRQQLIPARVDAKTNEVTLLEPHYVPEGQVLVIYDRDRCVGGGTIESAWLCS